MRRPSIERSVAAMKSGGAERMVIGSRRSKPAIVWRTSAASLTVRAMGPGCPKKLGAGGPGTPEYPETRPRVGLMVYVPQKFEGNAQGTSAVASGGDGSEVCCDGRRSATAGASGGAGGVPRVFAGNAEGVFACADEAVFGAVCFAEDDASVFEDAVEECGVVEWDVVFEDYGPAGGADATGHLVVFDGDGKAVERSEIIAVHDCLFGGFCLVQSDVVGDEEEGVQLRVDALDAVEEESGQFDR